MSKHLPKTAKHSQPSQRVVTPELALHEQLLAELMVLSFHAFEQCLCELLTSLGYTQVRLLGRTEWRQPTRHGGSDLEAAAEAGVSHTRLLVQVKQYKRTVSRRFVDELRGTLMRLGGGQGLIMTTSTFSPVAEQAAMSNQVTPIRLVAGPELLDLLITHRIGVQNGDGGETGVDTGYFAALHQRYPRRIQTRQTQHSQLHLFPNTRPSAADRGNQGGGMLWKTHMFGGLSSLWLLNLVPGIVTASTLLPLAGMAALGALLPDLDASESKIKHLSVGGVTPFAPIAQLAHRTLGHRGILHSLTGLMGLSLIAIPVFLFWGVAPYLALLLGYLSHLALDALTPHGIPFLPGNTTRQHLLPRKLRIPTGSLLEDAVFVTLALMTFVLVFSLLARI